MTKPANGSYSGSVGFPSAAWGILGELFDIDVDQFTGGLLLIADHRFGQSRIKVTKPRDAIAVQDPPLRRRVQTEMPANAFCAPAAVHHSTR